jgi:transcriptional regulator with XRE-family HTH domain
MLPRDVSKRAGISESALSHILKGTRHPSVETLRKLSPVLSTSLSKLMYEAGYVPDEKPSDNMVEIIGKTDSVGNVVSAPSKKYIDILKSEKAIEVRGDSMLPFVGEGDIIIFNPSVKISSGNNVYVKLFGRNPMIRKYIGNDIDNGKTCTLVGIRCGRSESVLEKNIEFIYKIVSVIYQ